MKEATKFIKGLFGIGIKTPSGKVLKIMWVMIAIFIILHIINIILHNYVK